MRIKTKKKKIDLRAGGSQPSGTQAFSKVSDKERGNIEATSLTSDMNKRGQKTGRQAYDEKLKKTQKTQIAKVEKQRQENLPPEHRRPITQEEKDAGLTQELIDKGMSMKSYGTVTPVTTSDVLTATGIGGAVKGAISKGIGVIGEKLAAKYATEQAIKHETSIATIQALTGKSRGEIEGIIKSKLAGKEINKIVEETSAKTLGMGKKLKTAGKIGIGVLSLGATISSADGIIAWYAMDNMATTAKQNINKALWAAKKNPENATELLANAEKDIKELQGAREKLIASTKYNPFIMPYAKYVQMGMDGDQRAIDMDLASIQKIIGNS